MNKKLISFVACLSLIFCVSLTSCESKGPNPLIGTWRWEPGLGYYMQYTFNESETFTYTSYKGETWKGDYEYTSTTLTLTTTSKDGRNYNGSPETYSYRIDSNTLYIDFDGEVAFVKQ